MQEARLVGTDLQIIKILSRNSRTPYSDIASAVGRSTNATKVRIKKMVSNGVIERFVVLVNPARAISYNIAKYPKKKRMKMTMPYDEPLH